VDNLDRDLVRDHRDGYGRRDQQEQVSQEGRAE